MSGRDAIFRVACVQMTSSTDIALNIADSTAMIRDAAKAGAKLIQLPEMVSLLDQRSGRLIENAVTEAEDPALKAYRALAADLGVWILAGSLPIQAVGGKLWNRCYLLGSTGRVVATYDKLHLFDVDLPNGETYRESKSFLAGERASLAPTPWGPIGLSICYDLRFPYLYRAYAKAGARYLSVPAAFTRPTGEAHWHVLLRARAIETGCYVFAAAQSGEHADGRKTFGHSLIVDPWGEVIADGGTEPGVILADIDPAKVDEARSRVPALEHDRPVIL